MKKIFLMLSMVVLAATMSAQKVDKKLVQSIDSTIVNDFKLMISNDRLFSTGGLIEHLSKAVSEEKAKTGDVVNLTQTQKFVDDIATAYQAYMLSFLKVDTVLVNPAKLDSTILEIENWQTNVLNDADIKKATTLGIWDEKANELAKLKSRKKNIVKKK